VTIAVSKFSVRSTYAKLHSVDVNTCAPLMCALHVLLIASLRNGQPSPWVLLARPSADSCIQPHPMRKVGEGGLHQVPNSSRNLPSPPHYTSLPPLPWSGMKRGSRPGFRIRGITNKSSVFLRGLFANLVDLGALSLEFLKPACLRLVPQGSPGSCHLVAPAS